MIDRIAYEPRNVHNGIEVGYEKKQVKLDGTIKVVMDGAEMKKDIQGVHDNNLEVAGGIWPARIIEGCKLKSAMSFEVTAGNRFTGDTEIETGESPVQLQ